MVGLSSSRPVLRPRPAATPGLLLRRERHRRVGRQRVDLLVPGGIPAGRQREDLLPRSEREAAVEQLPARLRRLAALLGMLGADVWLQEVGGSPELLLPLS